MQHGETPAVPLRELDGHAEGMRRGLREVVRDEDAAEDGHRCSFTGPRGIALPIAEDEQAAAEGDLGREESRLASHDPPTVNENLIAAPEAEPQALHDAT